MLLHEVIEFAAVRTPDATALVFEDRSWTFGELWADIEVAAAWLAERTDPGDRIAIVSDNRPEVVVLMYAAPMVGVVAMFANTRLVDSEIADLIADVSPVLELRSDELDELGALNGLRAANFGGSAGTAGCCALSWAAETVRWAGWRAV